MECFSLLSSLGVRFGLGLFTMGVQRGRNLLVDAKRPLIRAANLGLSSEISGAPMRFSRNRLIPNLAGI
jgi:hypothetical protein